MLRFSAVSQASQDPSHGTVAEEVEQIFQKYIRLARDLVFNLPSERDRSVAALWVKALATPQPEGLEHLELPIEDKINYARHLALSLHGPALSGRMANPPPTDGPPEPYPEFNLRRTLQELMSDGTWKPTVRLHERSREMATCWSGGGRVYASSQCLRGHAGAEAYLAVSATPWEEQAAEDLRLRAMMNANDGKTTNKPRPKAPGGLPPVDWDSFTRDLMHDLIRERMESELATTAAQFGLEGLRVGTAPEIPNPLVSGSRDYLPQIPPSPRERQLMKVGAGEEEEEQQGQAGGASRSGMISNSQASRSGMYSTSQIQGGSRSGVNAASASQMGGKSNASNIGTASSASRQQMSPSQMNASASRQQMSPSQMNASASNAGMASSASRQQMSSSQMNTSASRQQMAVSDADVRSHSSGLQQSGSKMNAQGSSEFRRDSEDCEEEDD